MRPWRQQEFLKAINWTYASQEVKDKSRKEQHSQKLKGIRTQRLISVLRRDLSPILFRFVNCISDSILTSKMYGTIHRDRHVERWITRDTQLSRDWTCSLFCFLRAAHTDKKPRTGSSSTARCSWLEYLLKSCTRGHLPHVLLLTGQE